MTENNRLKDAVAYWEKKRLFFNAVLVGTYLLTFILNGIFGEFASKQGLQIGVYGLVILVLGGNLLFCSVYLVELLISSPTMRKVLFTLSLVIGFIVSFVFGNALSSLGFWSSFG